MKEIRIYKKGDEQITMISEGYRHTIPEKNYTCTDTLQNMIYRMTKVFDYKLISLERK